MPASNKSQNPTSEEGQQSLIAAPESVVTKEDDVVTPYEVKASSKAGIDYERLIRNSKCSFC